MPKKTKRKASKGMKMMTDAQMRKMMAQKMEKRMGKGKMANPKKRTTKKRRKSKGGRNV